MLRTNRIALAVCVALSLTAASAAQAGGEIRLVNGGSQNVHPYYRSNCFAPWFLNVVNAAKNEWVFFGTVLGHTEFTWGFADIIDPKCQNPVIKLTYTMDGEPAPQDTDVERTVLLHYDLTENSMIRLGDRVVVVEESKY